MSGLAKSKKNPCMFLGRYFAVFVGSGSVMMYVPKLRI